MILKLERLWKRGKIKSGRHRESGMMLMESLVAVAVLGLTAAVLLNGLSITAKSGIISEEQSQAGSLAKNQMEAIKAHSYIDFSVPGHEEYDVITAPTGYVIQVTTVPINHDTGQALPSGDNGTQKISVEVTHLGRIVNTITGYKISR